MGERKGGGGKKKDIVNLFVGMFQWFGYQVCITGNGNVLLDMAITKWRKSQVTQ